MVTVLYQHNKYHDKQNSNTFILNEDSLPTQSDADPYGKVMVFRKDVGWTVVQLPEVIQYVAMKHTHWTFTPETP